MPNPATNSFDLIAPVYDALAELVYGQTQRQAQAHFLSRIPPGARVLILGGGSGWILPALLRRSAPRHVLFLEASGKMLAKAQTYFQQHAPSSAGRVEFRHGTEAVLLPTEMFEVVLTPFVLDLFSNAEMRALLQRLDAALAPGGRWLHTDFYASADPRHRWWQQPLLWCMYRFFRAVSHISAQELPAFDRAFGELGYQVQQEAFFYGRFMRAQVLVKPGGA